MSSSVTLRLSGAFSAALPTMCVKPPIPRADSVAIGPAEMQLTRMPSGPSSSASWRTHCSSAAFALPITL
jgi:hypothetical protein